METNSRRILPLFLTLVLPCVVINFAALAEPWIFEGTSLQGIWKVREVMPPSDIGTALVPGRLPLAGTKTVSLEREFSLPDQCREGQACEAFFATLSNPADIYLNGQLLTRVGEPPPRVRYATAHPVRVFLPPAWLRESGNVLRADLKTEGWAVHGFRRGPVGIYTSRAASALAEMIEAGTLFLPLCSAAVLLVAAVLLANFARHQPAAKSRQAWALALYACMAALYSVSLSRLPRQYLPHHLGHGAHFALRFLTEAGLLRFLGAWFPRLRRPTQASSIACLLLAGASLVVGCMMMAQPAAIHVLAEWGVILFPATPLLGTYAASRSDGNKALILPFVGFFAMQVWDFLALSGHLPDIYFSRFVPVVVVAIFATLLRDAVEASRRRLAVDAKLGLQAAQVAHDIRSPLAALRTLQGQTGPMGDQEREMLGMAVERICRIAEGLLCARRDDAQIVCLHETLSMVARENNLAHGAGQRKVSHCPKIGQGLRVRGNAVELGRIVSNLLNNAHEATGSEGFVALSATASGQKVCITVKDSGKGFAPETLARIGTLQASHGKAQGNGLGLYHAKITVEDWGGKLEIESVVGRGSKVHLVLQAVA